MAWILISDKVFMKREGACAEPWRPANKRMINQNMILTARSVHAEKAFAFGLVQWDLPEPDARANELRRGLRPSNQAKRWMARAPSHTAMGAAAVRDRRVDADTLFKTK